jgi:putative transposase
MALANRRPTAGRPSTAAWRESDAQRLRQLEEENRKLKQLVAERALDIVGFKAVLSKKW